MAVSNTIGSNVFDILVGLGIPWGLQTMVISYGSTVSSFVSETNARCVHSTGTVVVSALSQPRAVGDMLPLLLGTYFPGSLPEPAGGRPCCPALVGAPARCLIPLA